MDHQNKYPGWVLLRQAKQRSMRLGGDAAFVLLREKVFSGGIEVMGDRRDVYAAFRTAFDIPEQFRLSDIQTLRLDWDASTLGHYRSVRLNEAQVASVLSGVTGAVNAKPATSARKKDGGRPSKDTAAFQAFDAVLSEKGVDYCLKLSNKALSREAATKTREVGQSKLEKMASAWKNSIKSRG